MRRFCTTSDTCRHKIGNTLGGEREVCTLNTKETIDYEGLADLANNTDPKRASGLNEARRKKYELAKRVLGAKEFCGEV